MAASAEQLVRTYFSRMAEIRSTGGATAETSFYSALEALLNEIGRTLDPVVVCNGQLRNQGAGHPDFGLYSKKQCRGGEPKAGQGEIPERGVVEVKPLADNTWQTARGRQASKYFDRYRLVLVTNYREFRLIGENEAGLPTEREYHSLAPDADGFWKLAAHPVTAGRELAAHFVEFVKRVLMNAAPLTRAEDVAWFLASYARDALIVLEAGDASALAPLRSALETALGIKFEGGKGEHFFRSTLVQTLFYGVFSAWVVWARAAKVGSFDWRHSAFILTTPMIRSLFEEIAKPSRLAPLGLMDLLDRTGEALARIDRVAFFKSFDTDQAVQHFYEPFLQAFDPVLRKQLGVWYTPREIVHYMVERVDSVLRSELGVADGLADRNVYVLDPCCGTGAFVIEVLRRIKKTKEEQGADPLLGEDIKAAAQNRVFGFEILSAPFVIAHWQVGTFLAGLKAPLDPERGERAAVYLTNSLTGWKSAGSKAIPLFPEFERERDAAEHVKRDVKILVVLGNPPYNAFAGTSPEEEEGLVDPYKIGLIKDWKIKKFNMDEIYVRFFSIAERRIASTGRGIISYISNHSYVGEPSFVVMRQNLLRTFDKFWIENMHGDRKKSEYAPDGRTSETVFAVRGFSPGIRQGVVVALAAKTGRGRDAKVVRFRDDLNAAKAEDRRRDLVDSLGSAQFNEQYQLANPQSYNWLSLKPLNIKSSYLSWPRITELAASEPDNGLMEKRGGALIDTDRKALADRMQIYFDNTTSWPAYNLSGGPLAKDYARFNAERTRGVVIKQEKFDESRIVRYLERPFDVAYCYYCPIRPLWNEPRPGLWQDYQITNNWFVLGRRFRGAEPEGPPFLFSRLIGNDHSLRTDAYFFPVWVTVDHGTLLGKSIKPNLSADAREYLFTLGMPDPATDVWVTELIWFHILAIGFSPRYLEEHKDGIAIDWPRIPLPKDRERLEASAALGRRIARLLDTEAEVPGVTSGIIEPHLRAIGPISATNRDFPLSPTSSD